MQSVVARAQTHSYVSRASIARDPVAKPVLRSTHSSANRVIRGLGRGLAVAMPMSALLWLGVATVFALLLR